ncbi:MAG: hypothetical protein KC496_00210 [Anaerolineae bacterium]|nr:hypothetical protein [Anaerolineae bacterium]
MEAIKWLLSTVLSILGFCLVAGIGIAVAMFLSSVGAIVFVVLAVGVLACGIKEWFDERARLSRLSTARKRR